MTTNARVHTEESSHWYTPDGRPFFEIAKKDGSGMRAPTIADARKLGLLPSVTSILKVIDKPNLNEWKTEQAVLAVLTTPRKKGEELGDFVHRVFHVEHIQDEEARRAREVGVQIHDALEAAASGREWDKSLQAFVNPVMDWINATGKVVWTEKVLVSRDYAGRGDMLLSNETMGMNLLTDFKTCSKLPERDSYVEHRLQTSAYTAALAKEGNTGDLRYNTCNVYISTKKPGDIAVFTQDNWAETFTEGFLPLLWYWQWLNHYTPTRGEL